VKILGAMQFFVLQCFFPEFWCKQINSGNPDVYVGFFNQKRGDNAHETIAKKELSSSTSLTHKMFYDSYPEQ